MPAVPSAAGSAVAQVAPGETAGKTTLAEKPAAVSVSYRWAASALTRSALRAPSVRGGGSYTGSAGATAAVDVADLCVRVAITDRLSCGL